VGQQQEVQEQRQPQVLRLALRASLRMTVLGWFERKNESGPWLTAEFLAALHLAHHALLGFDAAA
jgi:hypothetical protein